MNPPGWDPCRVMVESICAQMRTVLVLTDAQGLITWVSQTAQETFPATFTLGVRFDAALHHCTIPEEDRLGESLTGQPGCEVLRATCEGQEGVVYRYSVIPLDAAGPGCKLHSLANNSDEQKLRQHFIHNLQQLKITREIVDVLYESLGTQEVIYLILVAVTSQIGFGFNRAFFLNVKGHRLRGRIGIGPSSPEEAHQIWTRIASLNFSSLREVYNDLTRNGDVPDLHTQEIALRLDFDLSTLQETEVGRDVELPGGLPAAPALTGLLGALQRGKPSRLRASDASTSIDRTLFQLLSTDAVAVVPLSVRGRLAGVIIADNFINRRPFTDADLDVLRTFAGYAAVALERSHLYDELRETIVKLQAANETLRTSQQKLLQAEKLSAIGELAAYVSHEIRNPLVAIGGLARSLLKDQIDNPETAETLEIIVSEVNRLEKFLRDTLDYVRPRLAHPVSVDLNDLVRNSVTPFRNEIAAQLTEVEMDLWSEPLCSRIDPDLLRHALSNLVKNAMEAVSAGGRIVLRTRKEGPSAVIRVGDTGAGIPPETRPRIFDPFFTTKPGGTGLGLSLASQNVRSLGGQIELEKDPKLKTVFKITLALEEVVRRSGSHAAARPPVSRPEAAVAPGDSVKNPCESWDTVTTSSSVQASSTKAHETQPPSRTQSGGSHENGSGGR